MAYYTPLHTQGQPLKGNARRYEMTNTLINGNRAVRITENAEQVSAVLIVNIRESIETGTVVDRFSGATLKGAEKWAAKQLGA